MFARQLKTALLGMALASIAYAGAQATPLTFTWTPADATPPLNGGVISNANNFNVADFANVQITNTTGAFTESGGLLVNGFLNGGTPVVASGLNTGSSGYSLFFEFNGTGTQGPIPSAGNATTGTFSTLNYTLYGKNGTSPTFDVTTNPVTIGNTSGAFVLGTGSLINGVSTLTNTGTGFSPTANLNLTFTANPGEAAFFTSPPPTDLNLLISNFSASTSVTSLTTGPTTSVLEINGGGGNLTFQTKAVPEPGSLLLLGSGLMGLGLFVRRRRKA